MPRPSAITHLLQTALARLDPRDILNFPECAEADLAFKRALDQSRSDTPGLQTTDSTRRR